MSDTTATLLLLDQVAVGDALPQLRYEVTPTTIVLGALAARAWRPLHHDHQAAWFERYVTDWTGPLGRLGRMKFRMKGSVFPDSTIALDGTVQEVGVDETGCGWAELLIALSIDGDLKTDCTVRVALPTDPSDNPWRRRGDQWKP